MLRLIPLLALLLALPTSGRSLNVVINNENTGYTDAEVYFSFRDAPVTGMVNGQALVRDQCYSVAEIGSGITLEQFTGGRIYFSLGVPLTGTGDPEPINSTVADWGTRFDKLELTYSQTDHSGVANLTAIDYFAIPLAIKTYGGSTATGTPLATLTYQQPGDAIAARLAALTGNDARVFLHDSTGRFLRVLGPTLAPAGVYPSFQPYLKAVQDAAQATRIAGLYSHAPGTVATTTQNYDFTATFDSVGNLDLAGGGSPYAGGPSVGPGHVIVIRAGDLAAGIYSANPPYTVDGAAADIGNNDVYAAVVRDLLTGYALGFVNSPTVDPLTGTAFKNESSNHWWASSRAFAYLQNNPADYDQYAAYLQTISNAYGYPFSDRWQTVQASLDPSAVGTMEIDVLPDSNSTGHPSFFTGEDALSKGVYYLAFPNGRYFGYYAYLADPAYIYHFDMGYEYVLDAQDGNNGVYLYDFTSHDFFYTSPAFPFPYLFDFGLNTVLYYYPNSNNAGHYNTDGVRYFYDFATKKVIAK